MLILARILRAMPSSSAFSIQLFISSWNYSNFVPVIESDFSDISYLAEAVVSNLQVKWQKPSVLTQYLAKFTCPSCKQFRRLRHWQGQLFTNIPILHIPDTDKPFNPLFLLQHLLSERIITRCPNIECQEIIRDGELEVVPGIFTMLSIGRMCYDTYMKRVNKISLADSSVSMLLYFNPGHLISLICHRGGVHRGHFVSHHFHNIVWFHNDDAHKSTAV